MEITIVRETRAIFRKEALNAAMSSKDDGLLIPTPSLPLRSFLVLCVVLAVLIVLLLCYGKHMRVECGITHPAAHSNTGKPASDRKYNP